MPEEPAAANQFERWVRAGTTVIAPATLLTTLLFYFGYVSTRSRYEYFGIDVDTIGLATQDYVMRSPVPLLTPLLVLTFAGLGSLGLHTVFRKRMAAAFTARAPGRLRRLQSWARLLVVAGSSVLGAGVVLLLLYSLVRAWVLYALVTPFLIALGGVVFVYGLRALELLRDLSAKLRAEPEDAEPPSAPVELTRSVTSVRRVSAALIYVVVAVAIFWMTATVAQWSGRGEAMSQAVTLDRLPSVIIDTKERLFLRSPGVEETTLPESAGQTFRYRYRNLRLLIHGHDRMFLVPNRWSPSNTSLVIALDSSVRVQFQFQNQQP